MPKQKLFIVENTKSKILENLEFLPDKVSFENNQTQFVNLNSYFKEDNENVYHLTVELCVNMKIENHKIVISNFEIHEIFLFRNNGENAKFNFTKYELFNYIDF